MLSVVCLIAVIIGVCVLNAFYEHSTRKYFDRRLSNDVKVLSARNGGEYFVYNEKSSEFTLKNFDWVSTRPDNDSLTVFCKDDKRGYLNVNTGEMVIAPEYDHAWVFSEGLAAVVKDNKVGFINKDNEVIVHFINLGDKVIACMCQTGTHVRFFYIGMLTFLTSAGQRSCRARLLLF